MDPRIFESSPADREWVEVTGARLRMLESSASFTISEKVHLLRVLLGQQYFCDVVCQPTDEAAHVAELERIGFVCQPMPHQGEILILACGNAAVEGYLRFRKGRLTDLEAGLLYGYPPSATMAFGSVIGQAPAGRPRDAADFFLGGVDSAADERAERACRKRQWAELALASPAIVAEAYADYRRQTSSAA